MLRKNTRQTARDECRNERERTNSERKKVAKLKTEDHNTNVFDKCFNLFSHENVVPCGKVLIEI